MHWSYNIERSRSVAIWLFAVALLVFGMVIVGGATRLTGSGLSITEWKPIMGAIPPLTHQAWLDAFAKYQAIPQYRLLNRGMTLAQFKFIFGWEWTHRLLGRLIGVIFFLPLIVFLVMRRIPRRLVWRCWVLLALGGLQGFIGWRMVASGLSGRVFVAPGWLATHLGLAMLTLCFAVWTGLEAWSGRGHRISTLEPRWRACAIGLTALIFFQILLGALVAGNHAGLIYNDWPLMNGQVFPSAYVHGGLWSTLAHSQAAVQFNHRLAAYFIFVAALGFALAVALSRRLPLQVKVLAGVLACVVTLQVVLGIATLMMVAPLDMSLTHQIWAVVVLTTALTLAWRIRRV
jgi:cytochrome c oxidase assembly protein subunit 15